MWPALSARPPLEALESSTTPESFILTNDDSLLLSGIVLPAILSR